VFRQLAVILLSQHVVPSGREQVMPAAVGAPVRRALEPAKKEALEQAGPEYRLAPHQAKSGGAREQARWLRRRGA
jgi:hypothetical protein